MSTHHPPAHRSTAVLAALLVAMCVLPGAASARPADDSAGPRSQIVQPSTPVPTVLRTVVKEEAVRALPIVLAGAALLISIAGTGYTLVLTAPRRHPLR